MLSSPNAMLEELWYPRRAMVPCASSSLLCAAQSEGKQSGLMGGAVPESKFVTLTMINAASRDHSWNNPPKLPQLPALRACSAAQLTSQPDMAAETGSGAAAPAIGATGHSMILILDFGSQYSHIIARRVRGTSARRPGWRTQAPHQNLRVTELNVYCEMQACNSGVEVLAGKNIVGVILSGGPFRSVATA